MELVYYKTNEGERTALVLSEGRKWAKVIMLDASGIRIRSVPLSERRYMTPLAYPMRAALNRYLKAHRAYGGTKAAKLALKAGLTELGRELGR